MTLASVAALLAALDLQLTPDGVTLVALQWVWLELWLDHQQTSGEAAPLAMVASVAASLAAQDPQLAPDGAALVTSHWLAGGTWCFRQNSYV